MSKDNHYVDNKKFSAEVHKYVIDTHQLKEEGKEVPPPNNYIGECFLKLATRMASKYNFNRYTWKDEMILDGVENCVKAVLNYKIEAATRSGSPNAYGYFSLIIHRAFLRRIAKEKAEEKCRQSLINEGQLSSYGNFDPEEGNSIIERVRNRIDSVRNI